MTMIIEKRYMAVISSGLLTHNPMGMVHDWEKREYVSSEIPLEDAKQLAKEMNDKEENEKVLHT